MNRWDEETMGAAEHKSLFEQIYTQYYDTVYKYVLTSLGFDYAAAGDCMQDIFTLLIQKADVVTAHPNPGGFFIVTAKNYIKKYQVKMADGFKKTAPLDETLRELSYEEDLDRIFERADDVEILKAEILKRLSFGELNLYELFYERNLRIAEIAKRLKISEANVKVRLFRLRIKVKDMVRELFL